LCHFAFKKANPIPAFTPSSGKGGNRFDGEGEFVFLRQNDGNSLFNGKFITRVGDRHKEGIRLLIMNILRSDQMIELGAVIQASV